MSQRASGYKRQPNDLYETPAWVTHALTPHLRPLIDFIWEPACGGGKMVDALRADGFKVEGTDLAEGTDFLDFDDMICFSGEFQDTNTIVTNPPFNAAYAFIGQALDLTRTINGRVAMLLRCDYDSTNGRRCLFAECPAFAKKIVLTKRIVWFERPGAAPSFNHAWYLWDWNHIGPPTIAYAP